MCETLFDLCKESLNGESDHTAVENYSLDKESNTKHRKVSYRKLKQIVDGVSKLIANSTKAFKVIGIHLEPSIEFVVAVLCILKIEKIFVPLEVKPKSTELLHMMTTTTMRYILSSDSNYIKVLDCLKDCPHKVKVVSQMNCLVGYEKLVLIEMTLDKSAIDLSLTDLAYITRTSGTTGIPKVIAVPNCCIIPNVIHLSSMFAVGPLSKVAVMSPPTFDPSIVEIFMALHNHATLVIPSTSIKVQPSILGDILMNKGKVTVLQATPSVMSRFSKDLLRNHIFCDTSSLEVMAFGGEACPSYTTIQSWLNHQNVSRDKLPNKFFNVYGISEVSSWASCHFLDPEKILGCSPLPVSLGCPLLKTQFQIRDEIRDENSNTVLCQIDGQESLSDANSFSNSKFPSNESKIQGKLYIGGKHRCCHIIGQETMEYQDSGDIVEIMFGKSDDAPILKYIGRADSTVKRNGKKLNLHHLAQKVVDIGDVNLCHVIAITSNQTLMKVIAFLVRDNNSMAEHDKAELITDIDSRMWTFDIFKNLLKHDASQMPDRIIEISFLPVNDHGKVDEIILKQLLHDQNISDTYDVDAVHLKEIFTLILSSILKDSLPNFCSTEEFPSHLDFNKSLVNMGGDSFTATVLVNWLEVFLDFELSRIFPDLFETVLSGSINEVIEKLSDANIRSTNFSPYKPNRKRKLDVVKAKRKDHFEMSFPVPISRGKSMHSCYGNLQNQRSYSVDYGNTVKPILSEAWKCDTGKCVDASPLVYLLKENEGLIYIGSHSHRFLCIDLHGKIVWSVTLSDRIESSACLCTIDEEEFVAVGCYDSKVHILNARSGKIYWAFLTGAEVKSSPSWSPDLKYLYCGSHDGYLYALDIKEKKYQWKCYCHGGAIYSSPCLGNVEKNQCLVFAATLQGRIICFCGQSGEEKWIYTVGKPIFSSPSVDESGIYFGCVDGRVYSLRPNGDLNWTFRTGSPIFSSPSISHCRNCVFIGSHDGYLYKICKRTGSLLWKISMSSCKSAVFSTPFSVASMVVSASTNGYIRLLDDNTGDTLSQTKLPGEVFSSPVAVFQCDTSDNSQSSVIFIGCRDNNLYALEVS